jgi:predicted dehydrogenase
MNVGIIGLGYWGPNLVRNFLSTEGVEKVFAADISDQRIQSASKKFPSVSFTKNYHDLLESSEIDAVAIATPVSTHYPLAKEALESGKHVIIEKPMTSSVVQAQELVDIAARRKLTLMVDHTFIYTGAVRKIKQIISSGEIGDVHYFDSVRVNLGLFQHDVNVVWDLATHDISIMDYLVQARPISVAAFGVAHYDHVEDVAYVVVNFNNGMIAHFHVNWLAPVKVRQILIGGSKKMIVYDDVQPSEKVKIYDKGVNITSRDGIYHVLVEYRTGDMYSPKLDSSEALSRLTSHFVECIRESKNPITDGVSGLNVVKILEAAQKSIKDGGKLITID